MTLLLEPEIIRAAGKPPLPYEETPREPDVTKPEEPEEDDEKD